MSQTGIGEVFGVVVVFVQRHQPDRPKGNHSQLQVNDVEGLRYQVTLRSRDIGNQIVAAGPSELRGVVEHFDHAIKAKHV